MRILAHEEGRLPALEDDAVVLAVSPWDAYVLKQILNEVCNGFAVEPFEARIGVPTQAADAMLDALVDYLAGSRYGFPAPGTRTDPSVRPSEGVDPDPDEDIVLIAARPSEVMALVHGCEVVLVELSDFDDFEFETRVNAPPAFVRALSRRLASVV